MPTVGPMLIRVDWCQPAALDAGTQERRIRRGCTGIWQGAGGPLQLPAGEQLQRLSEPACRGRRYRHVMFWPGPSICRSGETIDWPLWWHPQSTPQWRCVWLMKVNLWFRPHFISHVVGNWRKRWLINESQWSKGSYRNQQTWLKRTALGIPTIKTNR